MEGRVTLGESHEESQGRDAIDQEQVAIQREESTSGEGQTQDATDQEQVKESVPSP